MTEDGRSGKRRSLAPGIFFGVVDLHDVHRAIFRFTANQVNIAIAKCADDGAIDGHGDVGGTVPAMVVGAVGIHVADRNFVALAVHHKSTEHENLAASADGGSTEAARHSRYGPAFDPLLR